MKERVVGGKLPIVGVVNSKVRRREGEVVPYEFVAMLVGLIDGAGYFQIAKTPRGFIRIELHLTLNVRDWDLIRYIHSVIKIGRISRDKERNQVRLTIAKPDLQVKLFPLLVYHEIYFLTETRRAQYEKAMFIVREGIKRYSGLPDSFPAQTAKGYCELPSFQNWVVGWTMAEGSFLVGNNKDISFSLSQYSQFGVSSVKDIERVIEVFSATNLHPLVGEKLTQYKEWRKQKSLLK